MRNFLTTIHETWLQPELDRRRADGSLVDGFSIYQALVRLPPSHDPIVDFNEEIPWRAKLKVVPENGFNKGDLVQLHNVQRVETVEPPSFEGKRVAFVYLWHRGQGNFKILFDFTPNTASTDRPVLQWEHGKIVAESLQEIFEERVIRTYEPYEKELARLGLWAARRIIPYPLGEIVRHVRQGDDAEALLCLNEYFTADDLISTVTSWRSNTVFEHSWPVFESAISCLRQQNTIATIYTLVPQIEGVITAWLMLQMAGQPLPFRTESKAKRFIAVARAGGPRMYTRERMIDALAAFLVEGPVQSTFKDWLAALDPSFPNRHVVSHGRFDPELFERANLVKLILLLDSICDVTTPPQPEIIGSEWPSWLTSPTTDK